MKTAYRITPHKVAQTLALCLIFSQFAPLAHAASTAIADIPMAVKNTAGPNIIFTQDDSGSMQFEVMPESTRAYMVFPRPLGIYGATGSDCRTDSGRNYFSDTARFDSTTKLARYFRSATYNRLYYDPAKRYVPWTNPDKTLMPNAVSTAALNNPYNASQGTRDLTTNNSQNAWWANDGNTNTNPIWTSVTFYPATYFIYTGNVTLSGPDDNQNTAARFTKVEIRSTINSYTKGPNRTDCAGTTCTYAEEIQNFANWYTYYRSRILLARAGTGQAFANVGTEPRIGFAAVNQPSRSIDGVNSLGTMVNGVRKFDATGRNNFYAALYGQSMTCTGTPLRQAMDDVGVYYSRTDDNGPWGQNPGTGGGTQAYCRQNYQILMTDGYWNSNGARTSAAQGNVDNSNGPTITNDNTNPTPPTFQYTPVSPYRDSNSGTLADVAMYYWYRDLRPDLVNKVPTNSTDPAFWQHMVNLTVGLGVSGTISSTLIQSAFTDPTHTSITWPTPTDSNLPTKVDDLAHAAINSRGDFLNAADPADYASTLSASINTIIGRDAGAAAVAVANANVTGSDNQSYASKYNSGSWTGDLFAFPINTTTGAPNEAAPTWTTSAQPQLDARTSANRKIVSYTGTSGTGQGIQFQPTSASTTTKLSTAQQTLLNSAVTPPGPSDGASVVAFLRGDRSREGTDYRARAHLLGDIINAEPLVVREPMAHYVDTCYMNAITGTCATSYKTSKASRTRMVYQGANDGMLHAFNAATGAEEWAYIPNLLISNTGTPSTLNNLTNRTGFTHKYYVDGTPASGDVDFGNTGGTVGTPDWRTIAVGGLNKGGQGYYALDVTCPTTQSNCTTAATEADIAQKVLWEFPNSATTTTIKNNIGYSFGKPIIVKTAAAGWVVLVTSGYNNGADTGGDGQGYLFVLNAKTGAVIRAIGTGVGSSTDPSGFAQISAYVENADADNTATQVYGGDLKGNVWRFNLTDATDVNNWDVVKLAVLKDASGNTQPVTTVPDLAKISTNRRFVYVGTGQYLGDSDVTTTQVQTMYGLIDDLTSASNPVISDPSRDNLQVQTLTTSGTTRTASSTAIPSNKQGWYVDMPVSGERINTDPALALGVLVFTSNIPSGDVCTPGGSSWINILDYRTGGQVTGPSVTWASTYLGEFLASRPVLIKLPSGEVKALIRTSAATTVTVTIPASSGASTGRRVSWKELLQ